MERGNGDDQGLLRLTLRSAGRHQARASLRGSVRIAVGSWPGLAEGPVKARPCEVVRANAEAMMLILRLPRAVLA